MRNFLFLISLLLLVVGCNEPEKQALASECTLEFGCPIEQLEPVVDLTLPQQIVPEHLFDLSLKFSLPILSLQAHIEGVSMYMGKIPVMFEPFNNSPGNYQATTILGRCNDDEMQWRLVVSWQQNNQTVKAYRQFTIAQ